MSLIPSLHRLLHLTPQRSLNRRSKTGKFYHGKKTEVSFIITRSDLLAPLKAQVDSLMPYLVEVLRDALGSFGKDVRLGNVRCVSAKRSWWTKELKEDIWEKGGGGWMVGKVNVGKSQLFESVFPKGRRGISNPDISLSPVSPPGPDGQDVNIDESNEDATSGDPLHSGSATNLHLPELETEIPDDFSLLPQAPLEVDYPAMPLVSPLPGTTVSPIRALFGDGKGELIDLPGLSRGDLELFVKEEHRLSLVMRSRVRPEQQSIKPGQSLLLGGFIRITPLSSDLVVLAYAFTPISAHLTSTEKAIGTQIEERESGVQNIAVPGTGPKIASAGTFKLEWDVTRQRSGPITAKDAAGIKPDKLPYRVLSVDILIEGCGWVELVCQVRKRLLEPEPQRSASVLSDENDSDGETVKEEIPWPEVEVFSPEGRFISSRRPMGAWLLGGEKKPLSQAKGRPRKSMKGVKKKLKAEARASV
jgi:hypothetical protein